MSKKTDAQKAAYTELVEELTSKWKKRFHTDIPPLLTYDIQGTLSLDVFDTANYHTMHLADLNILNKACSRGNVDELELMWDRLFTITSGQDVRNELQALTKRVKSKDMIWISTGDDVCIIKIRPLTVGELTRMLKLLRTEDSEEAYESKKQKAMQLCERLIQKAGVRNVLNVLEDLAEDELIDEDEDED